VFEATGHDIESVDPRPDDANCTWRGEKLEDADGGIAEVNAPDTGENAEHSGNPAVFVAFGDLVVSDRPMH
jgi:hypothetical protein